MTDKDLLDRVWAMRSHFAMLTGCIVVASVVCSVSAMISATRVITKIEQMVPAAPKAVPADYQPPRPIDRSTVNVRGGDQQVFVSTDGMLSRLPTWTTQQAADALGVNQDTVRRRIQSGELTATKDESGQWEIDNPAVPE